MIRYSKNLPKNTEGRIAMALVRDSVLAEYSKVQGKITNQTLNQMDLASCLATLDYPEADNDKSQATKSWLEAAVKTGNVKIVEMLICRFPTIVMNHPNGFPCAHAFETHNLPILEALLRAGANLAAPHPKTGQNLINFGFDLFLHHGSVWPFPKNWYRRCMKRILTLRPTDKEDKAGYNFALECTLKALCDTKPLAPGLDKLLLRLLQAGADPNAGKEYFYMLLDNPKPEIITLLRRYGAHFHLAPQHSVGAGALVFNTLVDYAHYLMSIETSSARKNALLECKSALELHVYSGADFFYLINRQSPLLYSLTKEMIANKECIFAHVLRLPLEEKISALEDMIKKPGQTTLSGIIWARRGLRTPDLTNGIRALAVAALGEAKQKQRMEKLPAQAADAALKEIKQVFHDAVARTIASIARIPEEAFPVAATQSTTAVLYPRFGNQPQPLPSVEPVPAAVAPTPPAAAPQPSVPEQTLVPVYTVPVREPGEMNTNVFNAAMAALPVTRGLPPPYVAPKAPEKNPRVGLKS
jgi:hypothetical protein